MGEGIENKRQEAGHNGLLEAMGMKGKVRWVENLKQIMEEIGWMDVEMEEPGRLSNGEVVQRLRCCIWRVVKESWAVQV